MLQVLQKAIWGEVITPGSLLAFLQWGTVAIVRNKLLVVPYLAVQTLFALTYLWFPICASQIREEFKSMMSFGSCTDFSPPRNRAVPRSALRGWCAASPRTTGAPRFGRDKQELISTGCSCLPAHPKLCLSGCFLFEISISIIWHEDVTTELHLIRKIRGEKWKIKWENGTLGSAPLYMNLYIFEIQVTSISFRFKKK